MKKLLLLLSVSLILCLPVFSQNDEWDKALSLNQSALNNYKSGNYAEAVRLGTEVLKLCEKLEGKENADYAMSLNNLANYNSALGNYTEAIRLGTEALGIRERVLGKEHPDYANSLSNLAGYNYYSGNY
ncbi:MAG: tetratricopeptide repeat protein, partial [Prevotellaceae bacterium]|nr:tetratricopeptide repeat protein [Prevotellaceae bacterium]